MFTIFTSSHSDYFATELRPPVVTANDIPLDLLGSRFLFISGFSLLTASFSWRLPSSDVFKRSNPLVFITLREAHLHSRAKPCIVFPNLSSICSMESPSHAESISAQLPAESASQAPEACKHHSQSLLSAGMFRS